MSEAFELSIDIWVRGDMEFLFECLTREEKFDISKQLCIILFIT